MGRGMIRAGGVFLVLALYGPVAAGAEETVNDKVLAYARGQLGKQVGDGECATLAVAALRHAKAKPAGPRGLGPYVWGRLLAKKDSTLPGDVIQFKDARFEHSDKTGSSFQVFPLHTAIVEKVNGRKLTLLHQNVNGRRVVVRTTVNLAERTKGTVKIYRPLPRKD